MLAVDCTCGLEEENMRLKNVNESLKIQLGEARQRLGELETTLKEKEDLEQYKRMIEDKNNELENLRAQLVLMEERIAEKDAACKSISRQLQKAQASLEDHSAQEMARMRELLANDAQKSDQIRSVREQLSRAQQAAAHEQQRLHAQLQHAHARGRRLDDKIKEQERLIETLQRRLENRRIDNTKTDEGILDACCSECVSVWWGRCRAFESETASCSKYASHVGERRARVSRTSGSEMTSPSSAPTPPQRLKKKTAFPCVGANDFEPNFLRFDLPQDLPNRKSGSPYIDLNRTRKYF
ncbi:unnamed protein product [Diatraea saccharalis]|uniref:Uncharacterized protein n=1 Tax=Diatraea saccharalis TaxID=40085 RepID=A0A9N9QWG4_9NEOP|nr:unnamed protein product [Diatraea saccharalis]